MSSIIKKLAGHWVMHPPHEFIKAPIYEVMMGSTAYGVSSNSSDIDVYAVAVPTKEMVFPHLTGNIPGFGPKPDTFEVYQKHHIEFGLAEYDINVYSIIKYFNLCAENNPNMLDSLFVPDRCVLFADDAGKHMRLNRHMFLSKASYDKMRGYAFSEFKKIKKGYSPQTNAKRAASVDEYGYDVKSAYHVVRLLLEAEMILNTGDLDVEFNREHLKFVREGGYTIEELSEWFVSKERDLMTVYTNSKLPTKADMNNLKTVLYECLEIHFGSLDGMIHTKDDSELILDKIRKLVNK
jgi:predicted nucleotidyltransferase